jgi:hypothetical protein
MTNSPDGCACVALDCIIKDIAKQVTAAKQVLTVAGDLRQNRARKRNPMVFPFAMEIELGKLASLIPLPYRSGSAM